MRFWELLYPNTITEEIKMPNYLVPHVDEDADPQLCEELRELGRKYGPLGVAEIAANMTDPNLLIKTLTVDRTGRAVNEDDATREWSEGEIPTTLSVSASDFTDEEFAQDELTRLRLGLRRLGYIEQTENKVVDVVLEIIERLDRQEQQGLPRRRELDLHLARVQDELTRARRLI